MDGLLLDHQLARPSIRFLHSLSAGIFFALKEGHVMFVQDVEPCTLTVGDRLPLNCMFNINWLHLEQTKVGFLFTTEFFVRNEGGFLLAYMRQGAGKASTVETLVKTEDLLLYNYPNKGTLAVSPKVSPRIQCILEEQ